jgi:hypothetical protein
MLIDDVGVAVNADKISAIVPNGASSARVYVGEPSPFLFQATAEEVIRAITARTDDDGYDD